MNREMRKPSPKREPDKKSFKSGGFTLIEITITMAILAIMMGMVAFSDAARNTAFNAIIGQEKTRAIISRAKSLSVNSIFGTSMNACAYGVRIEGSKAFIFMDRGVCGSNNLRYDLGEQVISANNEIELGAGVMFIDPTTGISMNNRDIIFLPPEPILYVDGSVLVNDFQIGISLPGTNRYSRIIINKYGLISVKGS